MVVDIVNGNRERSGEGQRDRGGETGERERDIQWEERSGQDQTSTFNLHKMKRFNLD